MAQVKEACRKMKRLREPDVNTEERGELLREMRLICFEADATHRKFGALCAAVLVGKDSLLAWANGLAGKKQVDEACMGAALEALLPAVQRCERLVLLEALDGAVDLSLRLVAWHQQYKTVAVAAAALFDQLSRRLSRVDKGDERLRAADFLVVCDSLSRATRLQPVEKRLLFTLVGSLSRAFPAVLAQKLSEKQLSNMSYLLLSELRHQTSNAFKSIEYSVSERCLFALNGFLDNFSHLYEAVKLTELFGIVRKFCSANAPQTRFAAASSALSLLTHHSSLFAEQLFGEYASMYCDLVWWTEKKSDKELRNVAFAALDSFLRQISARLLQLPDADRRIDNAVLQTFVDGLGRVVVNGVGTREISMAASGLSYFAAACREFQAHERANQMLADIVKRIEYQFLSTNEAVDSKITYVLNFAEAAARCLQSVDETSADQWLAVESAVVLYYEHFPTVDEKYHFRTGLVSYQLCLAAAALHATFVESLVRQTLLRVAACAPADAESDDASAGRRLLAADYVPLWRLLLDASPFRAELLTRGLDGEAVGAIEARLFAAFVDAALCTLDQLAVVPAEANAPNDAAPSSVDAIVFANVVETFTAVLPHTKPQLFRPSIGVFIEKVIASLSRQSGVAGYYKLLTAALKTARSVQYFADVNQSDAVTTAAAEKLRCFTLISLFTDQLSLKIGLSYMPLAVASLDALEEWLGRIPPADLLSLLRRVLPSFDTYLPADVIVAESKSAYATRRRKVVVGLKHRDRHLERDPFDGDTGGGDGGGDGDLRSVRRRMLLLLGRLGGELNKYALSEGDGGDEAVAWDDVDHLRFVVPFPDLKPLIALDRFLPQACALAVESAQRPTKVAACECLHSIVQFLLGAQAGVAHDTRPPMDKLLRRVFPVLLQLSCDADEIPKQLFRPLTLQIIHWFTSSKARENPEMAALLDSLIDAVATESKPEMRRYAAECLDEFLRWSIKHSTDVTNATALQMATSVFERLYSLARHPSPQKRFGAALAFNCICATFREEAHLVDKFALELLSVYLDSLALAHSDDSAVGTEDVCAEAVDRLRKVAVGCARQPSPYLNALTLAPTTSADKPKTRRQPAEWREASLSGAFDWLTAQLARPQSRFRQKCWELVEALSPIVTECDSFAGYLRSTLQSVGTDHLITRFETGIAQSPTGSLDGRLRWLDGLQAALDCYLMYLTNSADSIHSFFANTGAVRSRLFECIQLFLSDFVSDHVGCRADSSSIERSVQRAKCFVAVRLLSFLTALLQLDRRSNCLDKCVRSSFWLVDNLWLLVGKCLFEMGAFGFDVADEEVGRQLPILMQSFLSTIVNAPPSSNFKPALAVFTDLIQKRFPFPNATELLKDDSPSGLLADATARLDGYTVLGKAGVASVPTDALTASWAAVRDHCLVVARQPRAASLVFARRLLLFIWTANEPASRASVVAALLDQSPLRQTTGGSRSCTIGHVAVARLASALGEALVGAPGDTVKLVLASGCGTDSLQLLTALLDSVSDSAALRQRSGSNIASAVVSQWMEIEAFSVNSGTNGAMLVLRLLQKLVSINSQFLLIKCESGECEFPPNYCKMAAFYASLLRRAEGERANDDFPMAERLKALEMLGVFALLPPNAQTQPVEDALQSALRALLVASLPAQSSENGYEEGTTRHSEYVDVLRRLLQALQVSESAMLLRLLVEIVCREREHAASDEVKLQLCRASRRMAASTCLQLLRVAFDLFLGEHGEPARSGDARLNVVDKIVLPMLNGLDADRLSPFFVLEIKRIVAIVELSFDKVPSGELSSLLAKKIGCFKLLEFMYAKLSTERVKGTINDEAAAETKATGLLKKLVTAGRAARAEQQRMGCAAEALLALRCSAHNMLIALVSKTQRESKLYASFLFPSELWSLIVDNSYHYSFEVDFERLPARRLRLLRLRRALREASAGAADGGEAALRSGSSLRLLSTQVLAASSLSTSASRFDFTDSLSAAATPPAAAAALADQMSMHEEKDAEEEFGDEWDMELDALNRHPCMQPTVDLIRHLVDNAIMPVDVGRIATRATVDAARLQAARQMPVWMSALLDVMSNRFSAVNTKMFIARLVTHLKETFATHARQWAPLLIDLALDDAMGGGSLHYFRVDVLLVVLGWATAGRLTEMAVAGESVRLLVEYVARNCFHPNAAVQSRNVRLADLLCASFPNSVGYNSPHLVEILVTAANRIKSSADAKTASGEEICALQLVAVLLKHGLSPLGSNDGPETRNGFFDGVLPWFTSANQKQTRLYTAGAEVIGLALAYLEKNHPSEALTKPQAQLKALALHGDSQGRFLRTLHAIHRHYPKIVDSFESRLASCAAKLFGEFRTQCLEMLCSVRSPAERLFREMTDTRLKALLAAGADVESQVWALRLLLHLLRHDLPAERVAPLLSHLRPLASAASSVECRNVLAECCVYLYDHLRNGSQNAHEQVFRFAKQVLLRLLADENALLRQNVCSFWSHESRCPGDTASRLAALLRDAFDSDTEQQFLAYASYLQLQLISRHDFDKPLFPNPLSGCKFEDLTVVTSWRKRHATLQMPSVGDSQAMPAGVATAREGVASTAVSASAVRLRATQAGAPLFSQTGQSLHHDWLSGDTYADVLLTGQTADGAAALPTSADTSVAGQPASKYRKVVRQVGPSFGSARLAAPTAEASSGGGGEGEVQRLRRRILKDRVAAGYLFARAATTAKVAKREQLREARQSAGQRVRLYRSYRVGDYPDIQVPHSALIAPLQVLAQRDATTAGLLFGSLLGGVVEELISSRSDEAVRNIADGVSSVLSGCRSAGPLVGAVLSVCCRFPESFLRDSAVQPSDVSAAALTASKQQVAIIALENSLIGSNLSASSRPEGPPRHDSAVWIELAALYKSIGDMDTVRAIFAVHLNASADTRLGLDCEFEHDYEAAIKHYVAAMKSFDGELSDEQLAEEELLSASRVQCLQQLNRWSEVGAVADQVIGADAALAWEADERCMHALSLRLLAETNALADGSATDDSAFRRKLTEWEGDSGKLALLEARSAFELSVLSIASRPEASRQFCDQAISNYLHQWPLLAWAMRCTRQSLLDQAQPLAELYDFLEFLRREENFVEMAETKRLHSRWAVAVPDTQLTTPTAWHNVIQRRKFYVEVIASRLVNANVCDRANVYRTAFPLEVESRLRYAQAAALQHNFPVAFDQAAATGDLIAFLGNGQLDSLRRRRVVESHRLRLLDGRVIAVGAIDELLQSVEALGLLVGACVREDGAADADGTDWAGRVAAAEALVAVAQTSVDGAARQALFGRADALFESALKSQPPGHVDRSALFSYSQYCDTVLRLIEDGDRHVGLGADQVAGRMVAPLLRAMQFGLKDARIMFPRLLALLHNYAAARTTFADSVNDVPQWMFLSWISQIMAVMDKPIAPLFHGMLWQLAEEYPDALIYPLQLSKQSFSFSSDETGVANQRFVRRLDEHFEKFSTIAQFICACESLASPYGLLQDFGPELMEIFAQQLSPEKRAVRLRDFCANVFLDYRNCEPPKAPRGEIWQKFSNDYYPAFQKLLGKQCRLIQDLPQKAAIGKLLKFMEVVNDRKKKRDMQDWMLKQPLDGYSPWFGEFDRRPTPFELPGQYGGDAAPEARRRVRVVGFDQRVQTYATLRSPKRLRLRGDDGRDYDLVVKAGEDLRQDERIERVFEQMNAVLQADAECRRRRLRLRTYAVVPMTPRVGLIEFVANAKSLLHFCKLTTAEAEEREKAWPKYYFNKCLVQPTGRSAPSLGEYAESLKKWNGSTAAKCLENAQRLYRRDRLRSSLFETVRDARNYFIVREQFLTSHATLCACHYIVGVGDRHLSNSMIDCSTGRVVGIDFGYAFGAGALLTVPELVPFRLTAQFERVAEPVGLRGQFDSTMQHTLRALRHNHHLLMNTMDVFIHEPSLDWQRDARRLANSSQELCAGGTDDAASWFPKTRLRNVRRKLRGDNPALILLDELLLRREDERRCLEAAKTALSALLFGAADGRLTDALRASPRGHAKSGLTAEQQTNCLIGMATDRKLLSRIYKGWEPWF